MDPQALSDRIEVEDVLKRYSLGVDTRNWDVWDSVFTDDAVCDFSSQGIGRLGPAELKTVLQRSDAFRLSSQHCLSNILVWFDRDRDRAVARSEMSCASTWRAPAPGKAVLTRSGGWYDDQLVRSAQGWRIATRVCTVSWLQVEDIPMPIPWAEAIPWAQERAPA